jgi:hypothetical protein
MSTPFDFVFFQGVVEIIEDTKKADRVRVRAVGFHTEDRNELPSELLPIASFMHGSVQMSAPMVEPGDWVVGFFLDGKEAQQPVIMGKLTGIPTSRDNTQGFSDPSGTYPKRLNEPTSARSARGDSSDVQAYKQKTAWGNPTAYAATYPFNHVIETDKGALFELDDTPGAERVCIVHHKGSYVEFLPDGTVVVKSAADRWDVSFKNHHMLVNGDLTIGATGNISMAAGGRVKISGQGGVDVASGSDLNLGSGGGTTIMAGGSVQMNGSKFDWGSGGDATGGPDAVEAPGDTSTYAKP